VKPKKKLRDYLLWSVIPLTLIPMIGMAFFTLYTLRQAIQQEVLRRARPEVSTLIRNFESMLRQAEADTLTYAVSEDLRLAVLSRDKDVENAFLRSLIMRTHFHSMQIYDKRGKLRFENTQNAEKKWQEFLFNLNPKGPEERKPAALSPPPFTFKKAEVFASKDRKKIHSRFLSQLRRKNFWWTYTQNSDSSLPLSFHYFHKILDKHRNFIGVFHGRVDFSTSLLSVLAKLQDLDVSILNANREVLSSSNPQLKNFLEKTSGKWSFKKALWESNFENQPYIFFFSKLNIHQNEEALWFNVGLSQHSLISLERKIFLSIIGLGLVIAVIVLILTIALADRITQPISRLVDALDAMKEGQWVQPVEEDSSTEIGFMIKRFNDMANSVQATKRMLETKLEELADAHGSLQQTQDQLVHSAKMSSLGQLVAGVAHELNNPIAFIYSNVFQMKEYMSDFEKLDALIQANLNKLNEADREKALKELKKLDWEFIKKDMVDITQSCLEGSIRVKDIVLGLKNFSRLDKGVLEECDIHQCLKDTAKLLASQLRNKVEIHWKLGNEGVVKANRSQINQVFVNLIANASQAIETRGELWIETETKNKNLLIRIRDNGRGISKENLDRIFDPFFTTKKIGEGTGLGLSIVYGIIQRHGGHIDVKSVTEPDPAHGTEFLLSLPIEGPASEDGDREMSQAS
jgi:two-component system NtrC family sensor kinase